MVFAKNMHPIVLSTFEQLMTSDFQECHWVACDMTAKEYGVQVRYITFRRRNSAERMNCFRSALMLGLSEHCDLRLGPVPIYGLKLFGSGLIQLFNLSPNAQEARHQIVTITYLLTRLNAKLHFTLDLLLHFTQKNIGIRGRVPLDAEGRFTNGYRLNIVDLNTQFVNLLRSEFPSWRVTFWGSPDRETVTQYCQVEEPRTKMKVHLSLYCSGKMLVFGRSLPDNRRLLELLDIALQSAYSGRNSPCPPHSGATSSSS